jgi:hypothetical protein
VEVRALGLGGGGRFGSGFILHLVGSRSAIVDGCGGVRWVGWSGWREQGDGVEGWEGEDIGS